MDSERIGTRSLAARGLSTGLEGLPELGAFVSTIAAVRASDLRWTAVRPPRLVDGEDTGEYRTGALALGSRERSSRTDVAESTLDCVEDERHVRELPMVSY